MPPNTYRTSLTNEKVHHEVTSIEMSMEKLEWWNQFGTEIKWFNTIFLILFHCVALYGWIAFPYLQQPFLLFWGIFVGEIAAMGVTIGAHRLWAHRTFKAKLPLRIFLAICYCTAGMNSIFNWVRDHRVHHKYTDTEADPHDSTRGFWFSHIGWLMTKKKEIVRQCGRKIDMTDIIEDPVVHFFDKYFLIFMPLFAVILPVFIPYYFFNKNLNFILMSQISRYSFILNAAWSVNSFAHIFGHHSYDKSIRPAENVWVSLATNGEGWHNYHHIFPWDYRASEYQSMIFNPASLAIDMFAKFNWAYDLKTVTPEHIEKVVKRKGDGTHSTHVK